MHAYFDNFGSAYFDNFGSEYEFPPRAASNPLNFTKILIKIWIKAFKGAKMAFVHLE